MNEVKKMEDITLAIVEWNDATSQNNIKMGDITESKKFLTKRFSYGRLVHEDEEGIVLVNDFIVGDKECEITTIPAGWITDCRIIPVETEDE